MCDWIYPGEEGLVRSGPVVAPLGTVSFYRGGRWSDECDSPEPVVAVENGGRYCPRHVAEFYRWFAEHPEPPVEPRDPHDP